MDDGRDLHQGPIWIAWALAALVTGLLGWLALFLIFALTLWGDADIAAQLAIEAGAAALGLAFALIALRTSGGSIAAKLASTIGLGLNVLLGGHALSTAIGLWG